MVKLLFLFPLLMFGQTASNFQIDYFVVPADSLTNSFHLSKTLVLPSTIRIFLDSTRCYLFRYERSTNSVFFDHSTIGKNQQIMISYNYVPFTLQSTYKFRSLVFRNDSLAPTSSKMSVDQSDGVFSNIFGPELSKNGSISRGFFVGSNRDFSVNSGFRLQMAGKLSDEIDIIAALTDENTPIQPQGNTQTLQEVDNVFVEIKSPVYTATLGDFQYTSTASEFSSVSRKLQGARVIADYQSAYPSSQIMIVGATARGKFHTNQIIGTEGSQGPYRLVGKNNERNIIVIAGTEKVFIDGEPMTRGDNNDYSIDYGSAEVVFSTRRLITGASRIVIDFEYSDRQFTRNAVGFNASTMLGNSLTLKANYFREGDDPDSPIDILLNESDIDILRLAGNQMAVKNGITNVGIDSLGIGKGSYVSIDTVINGMSKIVYRYEIGTPQSIYNISFSNLGQGNGDYNRESAGRYKFVGLKAGQYAPVIVLPAPQLQQNYAFQSIISGGKDLIVKGEYAVSNFDRNRFSVLDNNTNAGQAYKLNVRYNPKEMKVNGINFGALDISLMERFKEGRYEDLDRLDEIEFGRKWSTDSISIASSSSEEIREAIVQYIPLNAASIRGGVGTLQKGNQYSSARYDAGFDLKDDRIPKISYFAEYIEGKENNARIENNWFRHNGSAEYTLFFVTPSFRFEEEKRDIQFIGSDSVHSPSFAFISYASRVNISSFSMFDVSSEFEWRSDEAPNGGRIVEQANSFTQQHALTLKEIKNFSFSSLLTLREKTYKPVFQATNTNQQTTLIKLQSRYRPYSQGIDIDVFYDVATQRTASLERVFFKVLKGEGLYKWFDANGDGTVDINDEKEFRLDRYEGEYISITLNSDVLKPVINLKTSSRLRIMPARMISNPTTFLEKVVYDLSSETYFRIEERSSEPDIRKIYFLNGASLLNRSTTIYGIQFIQQDLHLFETKPEYSFRFRFNQKKGLSQYSSGIEQNYSRERSIRSRFQVSNDLSNQTEIQVKNDNAISSSVLNQTRHISSILLTTDISYRPETNIEMGLKLETSQSEDNPASAVVLSDYNAQSIRYIYGFQSNGQLRIEMTREEILMSNVPIGYELPYELTGGREVGKHFLWSVGSEYRIGGNVQFSLQYFGRTANSIGIIHNGKMEVRAFF